MLKIAVFELVQQSIMLQKLVM